MEGLLKKQRHTGQLRHLGSAHQRFDLIDPMNTPMSSEVTTLFV